MAEDNKSSKLGIGLLIGTIIGGLTAFFLSPKSGEENREEVIKKVKQLEKLLKDKKIDEKAEKIYVQAKDWLIEELAQLKETVEHIDVEKYEKAVENVMKKVQKEVKKDSKELEKLKKQLMKEWEKLKK